jgi:hypothetical protein
MSSACSRMSGRFDLLPQSNAILRQPKDVTILQEEETSKDLADSATSGFSEELRDSRASLPLACSVSIGTLLLLPPRFAVIRKHN